MLEVWFGAKSQAWGLWSWSKEEAREEKGPVIIVGDQDECTIVANETGCCTGFKMIWCCRWVPADARHDAGGVGTCRGWAKSVTQSADDQSALSKHQLLKYLVPDYTDLSSPPSSVAITLCELSAIIVFLQFWMIDLIDRRSRGGCFNVLHWLLWNDSAVTDSGGQQWAMTTEEIRPLSASLFFQQDRIRPDTTGKMSRFLCPPPLSDNRCHAQVSQARTR